MAVNVSFSSVLFRDQLYFMTLSGTVSIALMEVGVVILETVILKLFLKDKPLGKLLTLVIVANVVSFLTGLVILYFAPFLL